MKLFHKSILSLAIIGLLASCSNSDDLEPTTSLPESELPVNFEVIKGGALTAQSSTNTRGMVQIVKDEAGDYFVRLSEDFMTKFSTGTVTVYLSNSAGLNLNQASSFQLVSVVDDPGEHFFPLSGAPDDSFTHGIIWCGAAAIPFGFTLLD